MQTQMLARGLIGEGDIERMLVCETAEEVVDAIFGFYGNRALTPTDSELELMLYL
jgi:NAD(P)H-hydrate repair Nnr-like enzyme with NAD(P)H-hydrate epimerase domain